MTPRSDSSIEWVRQLSPRAISLVVFDFDGTLSWLRHGWPAIMRDLFREHLPPPDGVSSDDFAGFLDREILSLNGKPTIFQMQRFAEIALQHGRSVPEPEAITVNDAAAPSVIAWCCNVVVGVMTGGPFTVRPTGLLFAGAPEASLTTTRYVPESGVWTLLRLSDALVAPERLAYGPVVLFCHW